MRQAHYGACTVAATAVATDSTVWVTVVTMEVIAVFVCVIGPSFPGLSIRTITTMFVG